MDGPGMEKGGAAGKWKQCLLNESDNLYKMVMNPVALTMWLRVFP